MEVQIFNKYRSDLLKRVFHVEGDGSCVRLEVAEDVLLGAIRECLSAARSPQYDFWDQPIAEDKGFRNV